MTLRLSTATWNIGGGKVLDTGPGATSPAEYSKDGLDEISEWLQKSGVDIVTLQEVHGTSRSENQIKDIAKKLGYTHFFYEPTSVSHIDPSQQIGNGIISRFPTSEQKTGKFFNPDVQFSLQGKAVDSHDKGYGTCQIEVNGRPIRTTTLHLLPFGVMNLDLHGAVAGDIFRSVSVELEGDDDLVLIQGDFNIDDQTVGSYLPALFASNALSEVVLEAPTTPAGRMYDHVLFGGLTLARYEIDSSVGTDHYPVLCEFDIAE